VLAQEARRLKFLLTLRPGTELLAYTAHRAGTLQISESRLALHMVTGSSRFEKRSLGDFLE
jgi:alkanesulfonate monooxygenase